MGLLLFCVNVTSGRQFLTNDLLVRIKRKCEWVCQSSFKWRIWILLGSMKVC